MKMSQTNYAVSYFNKVATCTYCIGVSVTLDFNMKILRKVITFSQINWVKYVCSNFLIF